VLGSSRTFRATNVVMVACCSSSSSPSSSVSVSETAVSDSIDSATSGVGVSVAMTTTTGASAASVGTPSSLAASPPQAVMINRQQSTPTIFIALLEKIFIFTYSFWLLLCCLITLKKNNHDFLILNPCYI